MQQYKQAIKVQDYEKADHTAPIYDILSTNTPLINNEYSIWYDNNGSYIGHTTVEVAKKYVLGKLYYKTKNKDTKKSPYTISSNRVNQYRNNIKTYKIHTSTKRIALQICFVTITDKHLIDLDNIDQTTELAIAKVEAFQPSVYNYYSYPDEFKLLKNFKYKEKFEQQIKELLCEQKKEILAYLQTNKDINKGFSALALLRTKQIALAS
jgi:hypothetical protein